MSPYRDAQEAFNRASFDPPTPEIVPAETIQVEHPMTHAFPFGWAIPLAALFGALFIIVGSHSL